MASAGSSRQSSSFDLCIDTYSMQRVIFNCFMLPTLVHAAQFFNMVYPEALVQDIHYVNSFSGSLLTHPHFATLDGQTQIGFVNGAKPCSIGMIGSADFFLLNEESEDVLRFIDTVHCILDPNQQRLKDNGSVNGTALQGATTINNHSVEKPVSIVNLAGKIYLSCHNHRTSSNKWNVWELVQQTSKTKKQVFLVSEFDTIPFVYDGGMFVNTFQQTNLDRKDNAFSVAWRKGGVVFINDSFQTIEFFDKNSYEECIFRLYPNEALYLTQDTPTYLRVHRHKLKLFSYTPSQSGSVDKHAQRVVEVSKTAPRIERAELTNGHLFEGRFQIVQQMYSTMCSRYYLCKDTVLNSICVVQIFTVGLSPLLQQKILSSQDFFKRVDTAVIPNEMRLNGEIAYCVWPKCIHDATLTRHSAEMKRLAYVRQIIEIAIVLKANDRITTELFPSTLIVEQNDRLHFSGWLNTLREPTGPSDSDSPLLSSLFCTIIYFIAENQMVLDEKQWVLSEMVSAIPSSYSSFAGMCQKFLTSKQAYLHDLLEIFSVTKLTEKHRLQQIEQIVQRAADVGISIQLSLNSSPEEIAKYERLFGQITPQKKSEKNSVDMSVQNSDVQKKYEMIFIKSGGFFNEQGTVRRIVKLTNPFYASNILVTEGLYASLNPSFITNCPNSPKVNISWLDAVLFCNQLSESEGLSPVYRVRSDGTIRWRKARDGYRLPTEAEWELCVRANGQIQQTIWAQSDEPNKLPDVAVHDPNGYGIYDMIGLVWEWCWDVFEPLESGTFQDPVVDNGSTSEHVVRGGSMKESLASISTHSRTGHEDQHQSPWVGFRVYRNI